MAKKNKSKLNTQSNIDDNKASLLSDSQFDSTECVDYDEISIPNNVDQQKCEAFFRIASAEEMEEMSMN